jgi:hypothetical protein
MQSILAHAGGVGLEMLEQVAAQHQLEPRSPLMDQRLVEFGLQVPAPVITMGIRHKELMRRAVGDLLPDLVRERDAKMVHNLAVERDRGAMRFAPRRGGDWQLAKAGIVDAASIEALMAEAAASELIPRQLGILIQAELFWTRYA